MLLGGLGSNGRDRQYGVDVIADREQGRLACRAAQGWETADYAEAQAREKQMTEAESVRLLYVAATRAKDHLVLSLFRGGRAEESSAAVIERFLAEAAVELCPPIAVPDYPERETVDYVAEEPADQVAVLAAIAAERQWLGERRERIERAAQRPEAAAS